MNASASVIKTGGHDNRNFTHAEANMAGPG
jgi:hypothetical protein